MGTGQALLTLMALMVFTTVMLNFNRSVQYISSSLDFDRYRMESVSILTSHIEQLSQYFFDEASVDTASVKNLADMTPPELLGFENNDDGVIDDIDDFHEYTVADTGISGVVYNVNYNVEYVKLENNQIVISN